MTFKVITNGVVLVTNQSSAEAAFLEFCRTSGYKDFPMYATGIREEKEFPCVMTISPKEMIADCVKFITISDYREQLFNQLEEFNFITAMEPWNGNNG